MKYKRTKEKDVYISSGNIQITFTCPTTGQSVTTDNYSVTGWEYHSDGGTSDSGVDLEIRPCPSCGKYHESSL